MLYAENEVFEVLVATREEADELLRQIAAGRAIEELAPLHSIRFGIERHGGRFAIHSYERPGFGAMYAEVVNAPIGEVRGPVEINEGHAIFKVLSRLPRRPNTFEASATRARFWLRKKLEARFFNVLTENLRAKYDSEIIIYEDRLHEAKILQQGTS